MTPDEQTVERVAEIVYGAMAYLREDKARGWVKGGNSLAQDRAREAARAAIAAMKEAGMDRLVAEGQRCDAMTPQEAAKNSDTELLDAIAANYWDLKCVDVPTPGGDDADVDWIVVEHHMGKKGDVTIAQAYTDDPRAALRRAISETSQ